MPNNKSSGQTGWVGWVYFASAMMILIGGMQIIAGLVALFNNEFFLVTQKGLLAFNFTTWGWIHLLLGVLLVCAGAATMSGRAWGRFVGATLALLSALANLSFISAYPLWSIIAITVDILIIYALTMHGNELAA